MAGGLPYQAPIPSAAGSSATGAMSGHRRRRRVAGTSAGASGTGTVAPPVASTSATGDAGGRGDGLPHLQRGPGRDRGRRIGGQLAGTAKQAREVRGELAHGRPVLGPLGQAGVDGRPDPVADLRSSDWAGHKSATGYGPGYGASPSPSRTATARRRRTPCCRAGPQRDHGSRAARRSPSTDAACATLRTTKLECTPDDSAATLGVNKVLQQNPAPGTRSPAGTPVTIVFQSTPVVPLNRFKAPSPKRGNFLSPGGGGPAGWSQQTTIGRVYPAEKGGKAGLMVINRSHCESKCGEQGGYYFSADPAPQPNWVMDGPAFSCFAEPVPGTVQLRALFNPGAWAWAQPGTGEYTAFTGSGFGSQYDFTVCHVWPRP